MRFKVNVSGKGDKIVSLEGNDKLVGELLQEIAEKFGIVIEDIGMIRFGYPSQKVEINDDVIIKLIEDIGLNSGEKIGVVLKSNGSVSKPSATPKVSSLRNNQSSFYTDAGSKMIVQQHQVPDDNSCLFHAISYCMYKDISLSSGLRELVAKEILSNGSTYNEAILGKKPQDYVNWIQKNDSWGGGIEIAVLSEAICVAIYVLDMDAIKFEKFNEDKYNEFIIILFNGVHYDSIELENGKTAFNMKTDKELSEKVLEHSLEIAKKLKESGHAFNTHKANIICNVCQKTFVGERDVARHAESTGHTDFGQT